MKNVFIIGVSFEEQQMIEDVMATSAPGTLSVETTASFGQPAAWWTKNAPAALVIRLPADAILQTYFINKIKTDLPKSLPLLLIGESVSASMMQISSLWSKVRILKTPLEPQTVWKSLQELMTEYQTGPVAHRYPTDQEVIISSDFRDGKMPSRLKNLSVTGAMVETDINTLKLQKDELCRMQIVIKDLREYVFDCKIVWVREAAHGAVAIGLTFMDKDEVLSKLLKGS